MTTTEDSEAQRGEQWLDGLAGRAGASGGSDAHRDAARLRRALQALPESAAEAPPWAHLRALAGRPPELHAVEPAPPIAANDALVRPAGSGRRRLFAAASAAALLVAVGTLGSLLRPLAAPAPDWRGDGGGDAVWISANPQADAQALADELRGLGAQVTLGNDTQGLRLIVQAPAANRAAVNARLAPLEFALDADGRLLLRVQAAASAPAR